MPNQGNKSNGSKSKGVGNTQHQPTMSKNSGGVDKERSDVKHGTDKKGGSTGRTSNEGRKRASGGSPS
jgi:hypothetical protein